MNDYLTSRELDSELVIGLVCAVGTETGLVTDLLRERLGRAGYRVELVKVSRDVIPQLCDVENPGSSQFKRYSDLMDAGNKCRELETPESPADDSILANGVATYIAARRSKLLKELETENPANENPVSVDEGVPLPKTAYIVDSLKRPQEVERLRIIYASGFLLLGIHSEMARRQEHLINNKGMRKEDAERLIERDQAESNTDHGQRVNATFHLADFFVRVSDNHDCLRGDLQRLVELWFGNPYLTPSFDEYAMFMAFAAALRSADLSRQVGAVVTHNNELLSTGANECPRAGGGLYWPTRNAETGCLDDAPKGRDFKRKGDSNRLEQLAIIERIIAEAQEVSPDFDGETLRKVLKKSGIRDLTEFGRVVHAEMEALLSCARRGVSCAGGAIFCTTFPCHNCAKHIVAAGISRVVYVEPYSKSKAFEFHDDSIAPASARVPQGEAKVVFEPFVGVGPRRFFELFSMNLGSSYPLVRKISETGLKTEWHIENAQLRLQVKPITYLGLELMACEVFGKKTELKTSRGGIENDQS